MFYLFEAYPSIPVLVVDLTQGTFELKQNYELKKIFKDNLCPVVVLFSKFVNAFKNFENDYQQKERPDIDFGTLDDEEYY